MAPACTLRRRTIRYYKVAELIGCFVTVWHMEERTVHSWFCYLMRQARETGATDADCLAHHNVTAHIRISKDLKVNTKRLMYSTKYK